jgi:hypothetical protein
MVDRESHTPTQRLSEISRFKICRTERKRERERERERERDEPQKAAVVVAAARADHQPEWPSRLQRAKCILISVLSANIIIIRPVHQNACPS